MRLNPVVLLLFLGIVLAGCDAKKDEKPAAAVTPITAPDHDDTLVTLETANGNVSLMDSFSEALAHLPMPKNAKKTEAHELGLPGEDHYGWETKDVVVDIYARGGRINTISMLHQHIEADARAAEIDRELERFDEPTENAEGASTAAYLWKNDGRVRIVVEFVSETDGAILRVVGNEKSLIERGFPLGQLSELVKAFEAGQLQ
jgi:hypothetical protein